MSTLSRRSRNRRRRRLGLEILSHSRLSDAFRVSLNAGAAAAAAAAAEAITPSFAPTLEGQSAKCVESTVEIKHIFHHHHHHRGSNVHHKKEFRPERLEPDGGVARARLAFRRKKERKKKNTLHIAQCFDL